MKYSLLKLLIITSLAAGGSLRAAEFEPPVPVRTVAPDYPADLRAAGTSGLVVLSCAIDDKGVVTETKVAKTTNEAFNQAAIDAVGKWKFRPAQKDGKPVAIRISLPVKFTGES